MNPLYKSTAGQAALETWYQAALARLPVQIRPSYVETRFGQTHVLEAGPPGAPPLILLHPLSANAMAWAWQIPALAGPFRLILPDVVGHAGRSAPTRLPYQGPAHAHWLVDVVEALSLDRFGLAGLAFGGWLGMKFAAQAPERLERLALLAPAGLLPLPLSYLLPLLPRLLFLNPTRARRLAHRMLSPPGLPMDEQLVEFLALVLLHFRSRNEAPALDSDELVAVSAPTLLMVGEHEDVWPPEALIRRARDALPGLEHVELIPQAGHALNVNRPDRVNELLAGFFKGELSTEGSRPG